MASALKAVGAPSYETNFIASGDKIGRLGESVQAMMDTLILQKSIRKKIFDSIRSSLIAIFVIWVLYFMVFAFFLPGIYDSLLKGAGIFDKLPTYNRIPFEIGLVVRDLMPWIAFVYFGLPVFIVGVMKWFEIKLIDILIHIGFVGRFFISVDILRASSVISRQSKFGLTEAAAIEAAKFSVQTPLMRKGMAQAVSNIKRGRNVSTAFRESDLPLPFVQEISSASQSLDFPARMESFCKICEEDSDEYGEIMKTYTTIGMLVFGCISILLLLIIAYLPIAQSALLIAQ